MSRNAHPLPAHALETHVAILGKTGSGKSNLAKTIAERLLARGERVCVIDPTGTWWGLRLARDGTTPSGHGIVIFGGERGDIGLKGRHGAGLAEAIGGCATPAVIDTRALTVTARSTLFTAFAETLLRTNRAPLTLIIDEAHLFMPQGGARSAGAAPAMLHAGNNLVSLGRGAGLRIVLISQRPAKLHKDSLTQVETLVAMRLVAPQDRRAIEDWIGEWAEPGEGRELARSLPSLALGEAWVWCPGAGHLARSRCPLAATFDSGHTRALDQARTLAPIDIAEIAARLEAHADPAGGSSKGRGETGLAERLARTERALARERTERAREREDTRATLARAAATLRALAGEIEAQAGGARAQEAGRETPAPRETPDRGRRPPGEAPTPRERPARGGGRRAGAAAKGAKLTGPQRKIVDALGWLETMRIATHAKRAQVAFAAGYKPNGGAFNNTLGALRSAGLVTYPSPGEVALSAEGRAWATPLDTPVTSEALQAAVLARLTEPQRRVLGPLIAAWPGDVDVRALAEEAGYEAGGGAFNNTRGRLRSLGLIAYPAPGRAVAQKILFVDERA